jgi:hypothetical protein
MVDGDCPYGSTHNHTSFHAVWMDRACWSKLAKNVGLCLLCRQADVWFPCPVLTNLFASFVSIT